MEIKFKRDCFYAEYYNIWESEFSVNHTFLNTSFFALSSFHLFVSYLPKLLYPIFSLLFNTQYWTSCLIMKIVRVCFDARVIFSLFSLLIPATLHFKVHVVWSRTIKLLNC